MQIQTKLKLIDTEGISFNTDVAFEFSGLTFDNVKYLTTGYLLNLGQQLPNELIVRDSSFTNLESAGILIGTSSSVSETQRTKVTLTNNIFDSFYSESGSFVSVYKEAEVKFQN